MVITHSRGSGRAQIEPCIWQQGFEKETKPKGSHQLHYLHGFRLLKLMSVSSLETYSLYFFDVDTRVEQDPYVLLRARVQTT